MAFIDADANSMKCVSIDVVRTNVDDYASAKKSPQQCKISENDNVISTFDNACKYYYIDETTK